MSYSNTNIQPIFICSLQRSGSTLTQRILATSQHISTASEPHLLIPHLYSLKRQEVYAEYAHYGTVEAILDFCQELPNGVDDYMEEMRTFFLRLYAKAAKDDVKYFLDKTPSYHLIMEDVIRLFPEGKFIFLWRNPLAVASSFMKSWAGGRWTLYIWQIHLFKGLANLIAAYEKYADQVCSVRYEDLIINPEEEFQRIFDYLELPFEPKVLSQFTNVQLKGLGDISNRNMYKALSKEPLEKWKEIMTNPLRKAWCRQYLRWIGSERLATMGYGSEELLADIDTLPFNLRFLGSDLWWMPYGVAYRVLEGRIIKYKLQDLQAGHRMYIHS
jgi:hypothetical protein